MNNGGSRTAPESAMAPPDTLMALYPLPEAGTPAHSWVGLGNDGRPVGALRDELRRINARRNALTVAFTWMQIVATIAAAVLINHPLIWIGAFVLQGRAFSLLLILGHESAHRLLFTNKRVNDWVGGWLLAAPGFTPIALYRRSHMAHHRDEFGPNEPDIAFYRGYPSGTRPLLRRLTRDAVGISGYKNLVPLVSALRKSASRPTALRIVGAQVVLLAIATALGRPWLYLVLWLGPWMTVWRVINRLRSIAEHGGMMRSNDKRQTTHVVTQHWLARFWIVPFHTGWHLAHHMDSGVPWRNLPRYHQHLVDAGFVPDVINHSSYVALWKRLASTSVQWPTTAVSAP
jgi:fatty acid desaturase